MELGTEECELGMGQRRSYVVAKDAQTLLRKEEYAIVIGIGQRANDAAVKDVQITLRGGVCKRHGTEVKRRCSFERCSNDFIGVGCIVR